MVLLPSTSKTYFPIPVDNLEDEYRIRSADDGKLFREEYSVSSLFISCWSQMIRDKKKQKKNIKRTETSLLRIIVNFYIWFPSSFVTVFSSNQVKKD